MFDTSVYKVSEQLLGCVGCYKARDDLRELTPLDPSRPLADYLVQNLTGNEVLVEFPVSRASAPPPVTKHAGKGTVTPSLPPPSLMRLRELVSCLSTARATEYEQWRDVGFALKSATAEGIPDGDALNLYDEFSQRAGNYDHDAVLDLWNAADPAGGISVGSLHHWARQDQACEEIANVGLGSNEHNLTKALKMVGFTSQPTVENAKPSCHVVRQHLESCPACSKHHTSDLWHIATVVQSCWTLKNSQSDCQERLLNFTSMSVPNENLKGILESPYSDLDYAELFIKEHPQQFISNGAAMYRFNGALWETMPDGVMVTTLQSWLRGTFQRLGRLLVTEQFYRAGRDEQLIKALIAANMKICSHIKTEKASTTLLKTVKRLLYDSNFMRRWMRSPTSLAVIMA